MARLKGGTPHIDPQEVRRFFESRANAAKPDENYSATVFTDRDTAEERHLAEAPLALQLLRLPDSAAHVLDIGCGGGRWARTIVGPSGHDVSNYTGIDFSEGLIALARAQKLGDRAQFFVQSVEEFAKTGLTNNPPFSHILAVAVAIYLNDETVRAMLRMAASSLTPDGLLYLREGVVTSDERLTLIKEPSAALADRYSVVYRSVKEYEQIIDESGLRIIASAPLAGSHFARHAETRHYYFLCSKT